MWVFRSVLFIKPGLMTEAVAHQKAQPRPEWVRWRLLRPLTGPEAGNQLVTEFTFEDIDAAITSYSNPGPADEWTRRWVELNENRGIHELYQVQHDVPAAGESGLWVDRRIRYVKDRRRGEMIALWRGGSALDVAGGSLRVLTPRTGEADGDILVVETTCSSLVELDKAAGAFISTPEGKTFVQQLFALEQRTATRELLCVVP
jgi:hypothetical protein